MAGSLRYTTSPLPWNVTVHWIPKNFITVAGHSYSQVFSPTLWPGLVLLGHILVQDFHGEVLGL